MANIGLDKCLEKGITCAAISAAFGVILGHNVLMIAIRSGGQLVGVTSGNYLVHQGSLCKNMQNSTKALIVVASIFFTSIALNLSLFKIAKLPITSEAVDVMVRGEALLALASYFFGWGYVTPFSDLPTPLVALRV